MTHLRNEAPIAVFDSGLGGLTVVAALTELLPREDVVYVGDTARVPYGTRSAQTVLNYAHACARLLREQRAKLLVVACNTVSAVALDPLRRELLYPVLGAIEPGAAAAVAASEAGIDARIGVLATPATMRSGAYPKAFAALGSHAHVFVQPAPLLVPLVEEGWLSGDVPRLAVREYLKPLVERDVNALLLGCTHYPLLGAIVMEEFEALSGRQVPVIDSAHAIANEVKALLESQQLGTDRDYPGRVRIIVTDQADEFESMATRFLGRPLGDISVTAVDL
ncbi:MAG TPA: glutamate racemase [Polyangiales bacterium]|nr:glutamate racemase [Polyangiales bacterium]